MLTLQEIIERMSKLNGWVIEENTIIKQVEFESFQKAMEFVNKVAEIVQKNEHHPDILINNTLVRLTLTTHAAGEITEIDFKVAEEIDRI